MDSLFLLQRVIIGIADGGFRTTFHWTPENQFEAKILFVTRDQPAICPARSSRGVVVALKHSHVFVARKLLCRPDVAAGAVQHGVMAVCRRPCGRAFTPTSAPSAR
ncbi:hypothetical protein [Azospirillum argentinense]|uniref:hypothetical protein n=1 Tax=Azospirillum argentinense TaxID=2970906 RepID=UPI0010C02C67|nr:hypothetical protein [Azospirillum argentinense]